MGGIIHYVTPYLQGAVLGCKYNLCALLKFDTNGLHSADAIL